MGRPIAQHTSSRNKLYCKLAFTALPPLKASLRGGTLTISLNHANSLKVFGDFGRMQNSEIKNIFHLESKATKTSPRFGSGNGRHSLPLPNHDVHIMAASWEAETLRGVTFVRLSWRYTNHCQTDQWVMFMHFKSSDVCESLELLQTLR